MNPTAETKVPRYRLGVDIGGTFTDAILTDELTGQSRMAKLPSTPADPSEAFLNVAVRLISEASANPAAIEIVVHGTTVATNAVIEGKTANTGFVTTAGFRDLLEIARQIRPSLYDLQFVKPPPLVPRSQAFEVVERLDAEGKVIVELDEPSVEMVAQQLRSLGVTSVAVCLLHSFINPRHEERVATILRAAMPGVSISVSADIAREFREYFRASTTVVNAAVQPLVKAYLDRVAERLSSAGFGCSLLVMQSSGGTMTFNQAAKRPVYMIESGPAAGVVATVDLIKRIGIQEAISFDMGGTTAKVGLIRGGAASVTKDYAVGAVATPGMGGVAKGSGYPIRTPVIELLEIGAGGGSIAWIDSGGRLRVGPQSAGADPGPACYRRGGVKPTVSDANLVLGRLSPERFLGGEMRLDPELARSAVRHYCAEPLGLDVVRAAHAIAEIANVAMADAIRVISVQRGHDPRNFVLVAFGGAGPVHANRLAEMLNIPRVIIPPRPGAFSAVGLLATDLSRELSKTVRLRTDRADPRVIQAELDEMEADGRRELKNEGLAPGTIEVHRLAEMRYVGQSHELMIPIEDGAIDDQTVARLVDEFHKAHQRAFGFHVLAEPTVIVNLRTSVISRIRRLKEAEASGHLTSPEASGSRPVFFDEVAGFVDTSLFPRSRLAPGVRIAGPAVIEQHDSTCLIHPGFIAAVDSALNLIVERGAV